MMRDAAPASYRGSAIRLEPQTACELPPASHLLAQQRCFK